MAHARVFIPLSRLEQWLSDGRAQIDGDTLTLDGQRFEMMSAVYFLAEVAEGKDEHGLVGRVKSIAQIARLGAEHSGDAVVLGDCAYRIAEGYTLVPSAPGPASTYSRIIQLFSTEP
jgi:hypothetical protein